MADLSANVVHRKVLRRMSHLQGLRACFWPATLPPRSRVLPASVPGMFSCVQSKPLKETLLPCPPTHRPTPQQGSGRSSYCRLQTYGVPGYLPGAARKARVCDSSPPNPSRKARCDFAYHPPNFSRLPSRQFLYPSPLPLFYNIPSNRSTSFF